MQSLKRIMQRLPGLQLTMVLTVALVTATVSAQQNLPSMGEPADNALSPMEERDLGAQFMRQIRASLPLVRDVQIEEYIQSLGTRLAVASSKTDGNPFTFFVIEDPAINAFAIPGGYIGVNAGLIAAMNIEEQLAGVIAHEVAHVTQRHHARAYATGNRATLSAAAAVLAAILIGQASPQAGQAALAAGLAATQQSAINFTRGNEVEADRIGIDILANAQYDPAAMAESFDILRRKNSLNTSAGQLEYLRTHPLDNNRIAEAKDRAAGKPRPARAPQTDFQLFKARLAVLTSHDSGQLQRTYQAKHARDKNPGNTYALALLHSRANRLSKAKSYIDQLNKLAPSHPMGQLLLADIEESRGNTTASRKILKQQLELYPDRYSIVEELLDQLIRASKLGEAMHTANRYLRSTESPNPLAWRQLASIQQRLGNPAGSHESLAKYFEGLNELERAEAQLRLALRHVSSASQDQLRLQANLNAMRARLTQR